MEYLKIRRSKNQVRADGSVYAVPLFVTKNRKYGKVTSEQTISTKKSILVTGAHDSGKTRWIRRLHDEALAIWGTKSKHEPLLLDAFSPLAAWSDSEVVAAWWDVERARALESGSEGVGKAWRHLKQYERSEALPAYCLATGSVLFIDDAHKLSGRKLQIARECVLASRLFVVAASEEQRIPPNLRSVIMRRDPQVFRLDSEVSYDATALVVWMFIAIALAIGWWEAALVMGGIKVMGTGRRSARAD